MKINLETIKNLNPSADHFENFMTHYSSFEGTHEDFLILENVSHERKLWVILRLMPRFEVEVFAIDCAVSATYAADYASACVAASAASYAAERERQLAAISYLINNCEETKCI